MKTEFSGETQNSQIQNVMTIRAVEAGLFHADGRADRKI